MQNEVRQFKQSCRELSQHRQICTGEALDTSFIESWPGQVRTGDQFGSLVSEAYKLWRENWRLDIGFLVGLQRSSPARDLGNLIYQLRTARQHGDNGEAVARWDEWTMNACGGHAPVSADDWAACGCALMVEMNAAIEDLRRFVAARRHDESFRQAWQAKVGESVEGIVSGVAHDLGMYLRPAQVGFHVREVERRWTRYRLRDGEKPVEVLASLAERSLVSELDALPCDYQEVLDVLRVLGTSDAISALRLAHAVAEVSGTSGETFMKHVELIWATLRPSTRQ